MRWLPQEVHCLDWMQPKHRLAEHWHALIKEDVATSALAEHTLEKGHLVDLSKAEVIDYHPFTTNRCPLESSAPRTH